MDNLALTLFKLLCECGILKLRLIRIVKNNVNHLRKKPPVYFDLSLVSVHSFERECGENFKMSSRAHCGVLFVSCFFKKFKIN